MRATVTVVAASNASREDALVEAPAATASGEVVAELSRLVGADPTGLVLLDGAPIDPMAPLTTSLFRDGAILSFGATGSARDAPASHHGGGRGYLELRVVGGPAAGGVYRLPPGQTSVGRGSGNDVVLDDPDVSRRHAVITVGGDFVKVADAGSTNGVTLDGVAVGSEPVAFSAGARLRLGVSTLELAIPDEPPVALTPTTDGNLSYNRPPRLDPPRLPATIELPVRPQQRPANQLPVIATVAPLVAGVGLALALRRPEYLLFTVLSPLMMVGQWLSDRMGARRAGRAERATYEAQARQARAQLGAALAAEERERRMRAPDPASLRKIATAPTARLWERRRGDPDFLHLRLGCGVLPADTRLANADETVEAHDVPITVALAQAGVLGLAGPAPRVAAITRSLIGQLATLHSPRDLGLALLTEPARAQSWEWLRWLPHGRPATTSACQALIGVDPDTVAARVAELGTLIAARQQRSADARPSEGRTIVVVVDGARALRGTPGLAEVLANGPDADVLAICLDADESRLPEECGAVAVCAGEVATGLSLRLASAPVVADAIADGVSIAWAERLSRALAPLRDDTAGSGPQALPDAVRWRDLAGLGESVAARAPNSAATANQLEDAVPTGIAGEVARRWRQAAGGTTSALLGVGVDGPFRVDIARDGPHALIAGTTGSGKSELLQTLVASLAVANRPDELSFVLVDYKGGAAFGSCAALPHTVGLVTDLDGSLVERALVSLSAELKRREALLGAAGVANIDSYRARGQRLARLVIAVDEFASLAEELPDFVGGLVGIAQRGRSLGVHLVLATQRPEGVVSADIRANTNLRICLAVMRDSESRDVIDAPDAARISRATPGRGYARTGHGELHAFQCGRVGGPAWSPDADGVEVRRSPFLALALPGPPRPRHAGDDGAKTDLDLIVDACREAAARLDIEAPASPWLAPLPEQIVAAPRDEQPLTAVLGVRDVPARQAREPYVLDLASAGHLVIAGSARSGRTTGLRTLAGALARATSTADLHIYAFDCAGGSLSGLAALPHCGAVVSTHEPDRARRLIALLVSELTNRQAAFARGGFGSIGEQRAAAAFALPHVVVFIDGWESFVSSYDDLDAGSVIDGMFRLLREGVATGIHVVASAERGGLTGRLASIVDNRLVLRLADRADFALIGIPPRAVPTHLPAGRGFLVDDLVQTQLCLLDPDPAGAAQLDALARIAASASARDHGLRSEARPRRADPLPTKISLNEIFADGPTPGRPAIGGPAPSEPRDGGHARVPIGVGGDELATISVDLLEHGPAFVVAGPPRSGRSTALATLAVGLRKNGWPVVAITARSSSLRSHVETVFDATDPGLEAVLSGVQGPLAVLVDDAELVTDTAAAAMLDRLMRGARDAGHIVAIAGNTEDLAVGFRGFVVDARRCRTGVLLTPRSPLDGEALGIRLPRDTGGRTPPGRGLFVARGETTPLQLAMP